MDETNKTCCNCGCGSKFLKWFLVVILLLNTFFIGSIWCSMKCGYGKNSFCPFSGKAKVCPISGKTMDDYKNTVNETQNNTP